MSASSPRLCINCRNFHPGEPEKILVGEGGESRRITYRVVGECRAEPPRIVADDYSLDTGSGVWPKIAGDEWCGHWTDGEPA